MSEIVTYTGRVVNPLKLTPDKVNIIDIAHSLSNQCRFTGHVKSFYSVAQHSVLGARWLNDYHDNPDAALQFLLHDASEAYLSDLARPVKHALGSGFSTAYREAENVIQEVIARSFNLPYPFPDIIHKVDDALLLREQQDLMPRHRHIESLLEYPFGIDGWPPSRAKESFLYWYKELTGEDPKR